MAEPEPQDRATPDGSASGGATAAMRLQILSTEHWSLLASRQLAWSESFSRATMFLTVLTGSIVALALAAQASGFGRDFVLFALAILPIVLFVGVATVVRLGDSNYHDAQCVIGMNRIRGAYLELAPDLEPYFVMSAHDDVRGVELTMGVPTTNTALHSLASTPAVVGILTSVVGGVIAALLGHQAGAGTAVAVLCGVLGFALVFALLAGAGVRNIRRGRASVRPLFPGPAEQ